MKMTTKEQLENGCGFQDNDFKSSLCIQGNLCSECRNNLDYYNQGRKDAIEEFANIIINNLSADETDIRFMIDKIKRDLQ